MAFWLLPQINLLGFSTACKKLNKKVITGLIAHELAHFALFQEKRWIDFWKLFFSSDKEKGIQEERKTDKLAIRKGYGNEMIATKIEAKRLLKGTKYEKILDNYLTVNEVKKYMRKIEDKIKF